MKTNLILTNGFLSGIACIGCLILACTANAQDPQVAQTPDQKPVPAAAKTEGPTQIVFVPKAILLTNQYSGKLKENTFYWTNGLDSTKESPTPMQEYGQSFLRITGPSNHAPVLREDPNWDDREKFQNKINKDQAQKESTITVLRAYNVPNNAVSAEISLVSRCTYDPFDDVLLSTKQPSPEAKAVLTKNGRFVSSTIQACSKNKGWQQTTSKVEIAPGTQQLVISISTRTYAPVDLKSIGVSFETTASE